MPPKKTYRKKSYKPKKRVYKPKRSLTTYNKSSINMGLGFPKKLCTTLKYREIINHYNNLGSNVFFKFNCNGCFDPNNTGTGHQPYYFDQYMAIYDHYTVIGSKITIKVVPSTVPTVAMYLSLSQNDDTTQTNNTVMGTSEQSNGSSAIIPAGSTDTVKILTNKWSAKKTFGGSVLGNDNLQGTASANPSEVTVWSVGLTSLDAVSSVNVYFEVCIDYIVVFEELKDIAQS